MIFFFHLRTAAGVERDEVGLGLDSLEAAYLSVCETIPAAAAEMLRARQDPMASAYLIHDEAGRLLIEVPFAEVVARTTAKPVGTVPPAARPASDRRDSSAALPASRSRPDDRDAARRLLEAHSREIAESIRAVLAPA
jgi:hypothetical protein